MPSPDGQDVPMTHVRCRVTFAASPTIVNTESFKNQPLWWRPEDLGKAPLPKKTKHERPRTLQSSEDADTMAMPQPQVDVQPLSQSGVGCQIGYGREALSQKVTTDETLSLPRWHGGTLVPPPHLQADFTQGSFATRTRKRKADELTEAEAETARHNREKALQRKKLRNSEALGKLDGANSARKPQTAQPAQLPASSRSASQNDQIQVSTPTRAQLIMEAVAARVRAKESARARAS